MIHIKWVMLPPCQRPKAGLGKDKWLIKIKLDLKALPIPLSKIIQYSYPPTPPPLKLVLFPNFFFPQKILHVTLFSTDQTSDDIIPLYWVLTEMSHKPNNPQWWSYYFETLFYQIFFLPQVKHDMIVSSKNGTY